MPYPPGHIPPYGTAERFSGSIQLIDIGGGSVNNISRFLQDLGLVCKLVADASELNGKVPIIVTGVGNFGNVMQTLKDGYFVDKLSEAIKSGTPYLGIAIGMQILFSYSEESPGIPGINLIPGEVVRFKKGKCPQIGMNKILPTPQAQGTFPKDEYVYFVNSYFVKPQAPEIVAFNSNYMERFCAGIKFKNVTGFQFHPENSKEAGVRLMSAWLREAL